MQFPYSLKVTSMPRPTAALFVGNSFFFYNNGVHNHYMRLVQAGQPDLAKTVKSRVYSYSGGHVDELRPAFECTLTRERYDVVALAGHSLEMFGKPEDVAFARYTFRAMAKECRLNNATPVLFMSWAYRNRPEMTEKLADDYTSLGNECECLVAPVGLAFAASLAARPELTLVLDDMKHPTFPATYLAACTFYSVYFNQSPAGLETLESRQIGQENARFLQDIAWETTQAYLKR